MRSKDVMQILLVLSTGNILISQAWRSFKIIFDDSTVEFDERFINMSIGISRNSNNETLLNVYVRVLQDIDNLMAHATLTVTTANDKQIHLLNARTNFCRWLVGRKDGNVRLFFEEIQKCGRIFFECPIREGLYYLQEFTIDPELAPEYLPEAKFLSMGHLYLNGTNGVHHSILKIILTGKIDKSQGLYSMKEFSMG